MVHEHAYYLAEHDRLYGSADPELGQRLKQIWEEHRVDTQLTHFDGTSTWISEGKRRVRVLRKRREPGPTGPVDILDLERL